MSFDEGLAERVRDVLRGRRGVTERRMFGGLAFMWHGHMFTGVLGETLMARVGPAACLRALEEPNVREMDFTGRPMKGYVYVDAPAYQDDADLERWIQACLDFVATLPPKAPAKGR